MILRLGILTTFVLLSGRVAAGTTQEPKPYDRFSHDREFGSVKNSSSTPVGGAYPPLFWSLFSSVNGDRTPTASGAYTRHSPATWRNIADSSHVRGYYAPKESELADGVKKVKQIMNLGQRIKISQGPRRRRKRRSAFAPLCSEAAIDCGSVAMEDHVCCETARELSKREVFKDPEFGIPLAFATIRHLGSSGSKEQQEELEPESEALETRPTVQIHPSVSSASKIYSKRKWPPHRPTVPQHRLQFPRCPLDCRVFPRQPCCYRVDRPPVDRFVAIPPYVQPTLIENWVTNLFILFGQHPALFLIVKKVALLGLFFVALVLWGYLGQTLGFVSMPTLYADRKDSVVDSLTETVFSAVDGKAWLDELTRIEAGKGGKNGSSVSAINRFVCCFAGSDSDSESSGFLPAADDAENEVKTREAVDSGSEKRMLRCYKRHKSRKDESVAECVANLAYEVTIGTDRGWRKLETQWPSWL